MTAAYGLIGRHIRFELAGEERVQYRKALIERLATDSTKWLGRGFSCQNIWQMRLFYQTYPSERIFQTVSGKSSLSRIVSCFPLPKHTIVSEAEPRSVYERFMIPRRANASPKSTFPFPGSRSTRRVRSRSGMALSPRCIGEAAGGGSSTRP